MQIYKIERGKVQLNLHPGQTRAWDSDKRFVFVLAGTQAGKTTFLPWLLWREIKAQGSGDYLAVTASYDLFKLKFLPEMRQVYENILGIGRYWAGEKVIELKNPDTKKFEARRADDPMWGRIILRSAQSKGGLESATAKAAILDEVGQDDFALEDWEAVLRRLSLSQGRVFAATTIYNLGWLKSEIYDKWRESDPDIDVIQFASVINPAFPRAEFERAKRTIQDWRFQMFYLGQFSRPASLIYPSVDLVDDFAIPTQWPRVVGVDFGGANTATIHLAESPEGVWYAYLETLEGHLPAGEHVNRQFENLGDAVDYEFVGGARSEVQYRLDWEDAGLFVNEPVINDVEAGIDRVTSLIKGGNLRVFRSLRRLRDDLGSYQRKIDSAGNVMEEIRDKRRYHMADALRYACIWIAEGSGVTVGMARI